LLAIIMIEKRDY